MAKVELGLKRTCLSCDMRFYDFKRSPIICPGCGTEFDPENLVKGRKNRAAPKSASKPGFLMLLMIWILLSLMHKDGRRPLIRLVETEAPPNLTLEQGFRWHLFLSHTWASAQE